VIFSCFVNDRDSITGSQARASQNQDSCEDSAESGEVREAKVRPSRATDCNC
jgi:hypothetical protein